MDVKQVSSEVLNFFKNLNPTVIRKIAAGSLALFFVVIAYYFVPIVKVGQHSSYFSIRDAMKYRSIDESIASVVGRLPVASTKDALYYLTVTAVEREILKADDVLINKKAAIVEFEQNNMGYKGSLLKLKKDLGDDRYYQLLVEPIIVSSVFSRYYLINESGLKKATALLAQAKSDGFDSMAKVIGEPSVTRNVIIPNNAQSGRLLGLLKPLKEGAVLERLVEDENGYAIIRAKEFQNSGDVTVDVAYVKRQPYSEFIAQKMKEKKVPVDFLVYSVYRPSSFDSVEGSIFRAKKEAEGEK